jgi:hypothetical protein
MRKLLALLLLLPAIALGQKISGLPAVPSQPTGPEIFPCDQSSTTYKCTFAQIGLAPLAGYDTPMAHGAKGDHVTDDTIPLQACITSTHCQLPCGYAFLVTSTLVVTTGDTLIGCGPIYNGPLGSAIIANAGGNTPIAGPIIEACRITSGTTCAAPQTSPYATNFLIQNIVLKGYAPVGLQITGAAQFVINNVYLTGLNNAHDAAIIKFVFDFLINGLDVTTGIVTDTVTFTGSVGGAASGTANAAHTVGGFPFVFSDGEQRYVTIANGACGSGCALTWSPALSAGTITTATFGTGIRIGYAGPGVANYLHSSANDPYGIYIEDDDSLGYGGGVTFNSLVSEGCTIPLYVGGAVNSTVFNGMWLDGTRPLILGSSVNGNSVESLTFNSGIINGPTNSASYPNYSTAVADVDIDYASGVTFNSMLLTGSNRLYNLTGTAPITFNGTGGGSGAQAIARVNVGGSISNGTLLNPGSAYSGTITCAAGGTGSGATCTATQSGGLINTFSVSGGTGYTSVPVMPIRYNKAYRVSFNGTYFPTSGGAQTPLWPWVVRNTSAPATAGIHISDDLAWDSAGNFNATATLQKADGGSSQHYVNWLNSSGASTQVGYVPPVFP